MLTGQVPFEGESTVQVALMHIQTEMVPPTMHEPTIPVSLEKIILKCTQKKPESRYASVAALIADLRRALMTPDEDFVKIVPVITSNDPTRVMSNEEVEQIKSETRAAAPTVDKKEEAYLMGYEEEEELEVSLVEGDELEEEEEEEENPKFEKVITGISIVVAILIVLLAIFILGSALTMFGGRDEKETEGTTTTQEAPTTTEADSKTSKMPRLVGLMLGEAEELLLDRELGISVEYVAAPDEEDGIVLSQEFEEGKDVNKHYRVKVVVVDNSGIADIPMGLVGSSAAAVRKALTNAGFVVSIEEVYDDEIEDGIVISVDPGEGTVGLEKGSTVEVVVSKGPEIILVIVPKVEGSTLEKAKGDLSQKGLKVEIEEEYSDEVQKDHVISQSVKAGREVEIGTTVTITVSLGTNKVAVPDLVGMTLIQASNELGKIDLTLNSKYTEDFSDEIDKGLIMKQETEKDTLVEPDTEIKVTVSLGIKLPSWKAGDDAVEFKAGINDILDVKMVDADGNEVTSGEIDYVMIKTSEGEVAADGKTGAAFEDTIIIYVTDAEETTPEETTPEETTPEVTTPEETTPEETTAEETTAEETTASNAENSNEGEVDPEN